MLVAQKEKCDMTASFYLILVSKLGLTEWWSMSKPVLQVFRSMNKGWKYLRLLLDTDENLKSQLFFPFLFIYILLEKWDCIKIFVYKHISHNVIKLQHKIQRGWHFLWKGVPPKYTSWAIIFWKEKHVGHKIWWQKCGESQARLFEPML